MSYYFTGIFVLCLVCALIEWLSPAGEGDGIARHIRLLTGLCLLSALLRPAMTLADTLRDLPARLEDWLDAGGFSAPTDDSSSGIYSERWQRESEALDKRYAAAQIGAMLREKFSLPENECRVSVTLSESGDAIDEVYVTLSGRAIWQNTHAMEAFVKDTFGCPCVIYVDR